MVILFSSLSALTYGAADFYGVLASRKNSAITVAVWSQGMGLLIALIASPPAGSPISRSPGSHMGNGRRDIGGHRRGDPLSWTVLWISFHYFSDSSFDGSGAAGFLWNSNRGISSSDKLDRRITHQKKPLNYTTLTQKAVPFNVRHS